MNVTSKEGLAIPRGTKEVTVEREGVMLSVEGGECGGLLAVGARGGSIHATCTFRKREVLKPWPLSGTVMHVKRARLVGMVIMWDKMVQGDGGRRSVQ